MLLMHSKTHNSDKLLFKIPVNLNIPVKQLQAYAAYLWFKKVNRFGHFTKADLNKKYRNRNNYWLKKLVSMGLITASGDRYYLKGYQEVWRLLGVKKCRKNSGIYAYKYTSFILDNDDTFLKDVKDGVFKHLVERKKNQIAYRLASGRISRREIRRRGTYVQLSGTRTAKLFGYKAFSSGLKYRRKYFKVTKSTKYQYLDEQGYQCTRYECGKVSLF